jgi:hypothetical protein
LVDVFISYSRDNQSFARQLADAVRREGYSIWWDDQIAPHLAYGDVITEKIGSARAAIVIWSASAAASEWVRAEADVARGQKKLIQTSVDGIEPPLPFNQIQVAAIGDWRGDEGHPGWQKVKESLAALCGPRATPATPAPAPAPPVSVSVPPQAPMPARSYAPMIVALLVVLVVLAAIAVGILAYPGTDTRKEVADRQAPNRPTPNQAAGASAGLPRLAYPGSAANGPAPAEAPPVAAPDPPQILAMSGSRLLGEEDVANLSRTELRIARNEIFARHGRIFQDPELRRHFERYSWYHPQADEVALTPVEEANVRFLQDEDAQR